MNESPVTNFVKIVAVESAKSAAATAGSVVIMVAVLATVGKIVEFKKNRSAK